MDTKEITNAGLKRGYLLTIPAKDIEAQIDNEVKKIAPQVRMPGFRPGKVPGNLVRKMHGEQLHAQVVNDTVRSSVDKLMQEKQIRPAMQPKIALGDSYKQGDDAEISVELEVLPEVEAPEVEGLELERLTVPVADEQVDEALARIAGQNKSYKDAPKTRKAAEGDQLSVDFVGRVDGEEFEGGKGTDTPLVLGSGQFIPGFEEQLIGVKAGDKKTISVTFPDEYPAANLKGKQAEFDVTVRSVRMEDETKVDDAFAKSLGLDDLGKLRDILRQQLEQETGQLTRTQMKRQLLDKLAADHDFDVPEGMVDAEFQQIWTQLQQEAARSDDAEAAMQEIEAEKDDYRSIAVRRVRLGLLLSAIGQKNDIQVSQQEMSMLMQQAAQQYRQEDRQKFLEYVQNEPMAAAQLRAPLYEDKVVDFLFGKAAISDREVTREELEAAIEAEENETPAPEATKPNAKKPATMKSTAKTAEKSATDESGTKDDAAAAPKQAPAKKAPAKKGSDTADKLDKTSAGSAPKAAKKPAAKKPSAKKRATKEA